MEMPDSEVTLLYISHAHILHYWIGQGLSSRHTTLDISWKDVIVSRLLHLVSRRLLCWATYVML